MLDNDRINACFELFGAGVSLLSVRRLYIDKVVKGMSLWPVVFFTAWGVWNLRYYGVLEQNASVAAAFAMVMVNLLWLTLALIYKRKYSDESSTLPR